MAGNSVLFRHSLWRSSRAHVHWFSPNFMLPPWTRQPHPCAQLSPNPGSTHIHGGLGISEPSKSFGSCSPFMQLGNKDCIPFSAWWIFKWVFCSLGNWSNYYIIVYKKNMKTNGTIAIISHRACPAQASQRRAGFVHGRELVASHPYQK